MPKPALFILIYVLTSKLVLNLSCKVFILSLNSFSHLIKSLFGSLELCCVHCEDDSLKEPVTKKFLAIY